MLTLRRALAFTVALLFFVAVLRWVAALFNYTKAFVDAGMAGVYAKMTEYSTGLVTGIVSLWSDVDGFLLISDGEVFLVTACDAILTALLGLTYFWMLRSDQLKDPDKTSPTKSKVG